MDESDLPKHKITWAEEWRLEPFHISFLSQSMYDAITSAPMGAERGHSLQALWSIRDTDTHI